MALGEVLGRSAFETTEGVKPANLQSAPLHRRIRFWRPKSRPKPNLASNELDISPLDASDDLLGMEFL